MKLKCINVKNFRGIEDETFGFNCDVNCISGYSGSGKSRLMEALRVPLLRTFQTFTNGNIITDVFRNSDEAKKCTLDETVIFNDTEYLISTQFKYTDCMTLFNDIEKRISENVPFISYVNNLEIDGSKRNPYPNFSIGTLLEDDENIESFDCLYNSLAGSLYYNDINRLLGFYFVHPESNKPIDKILSIVINEFHSLHKVDKIGFKKDENFNITKNQLIFTYNGKEYEFNQLPSISKRYLLLSLNLVINLAIANNYKLDDFSKFKGILLYDLDIPYFSEFVYNVNRLFPNIQIFYTQLNEGRYLVIS